jgi:guanyl-specific ribonuclease Sa
MTCWRWILANLAAGLVCAASLLPTLACGSTPGTPLPPPAQAQVQASQDPVPAHARTTLAYIRQHGYAPPGYVGGRVFGNYEGLLPRFTEGHRKRIEYREWDVRPRAEGRNRGAERLVTGGDGRAWYSADHYRTFIEVK